MADAHIEKFGDKVWTVVADPYVTSDAGTGIVHQAPAFGEDDYRIALREGIVLKGQMPPLPLDEAGVFTAEIPPYQGMYLKVMPCHEAESATLIAM